MAADSIELRVCSVWLRKPLNVGGEEPVHFVRQRAESRCLVEHKGLVDSYEFVKTKRAEQQCVNVGERAVLFNCSKHYSQLAERFPIFNDSWSKMEAPFGEQAILDGPDADSICIGDVFESGVDSALKLRVVFPRLPCFRVDGRYPMPDLCSGAKGTVRHWVGANSRGGFFCSVVRPGSIGEGDPLKLVKRPNPQWSLARVAQMCYLETPLHMQWQGDDSQLQELCDMPEFGYHEWKERLLIIRSSILEQRPLRFPEWLGNPVSREGGKSLIAGTWHIDQCAGNNTVAVLDINADGTEALSSEPLFGGSKFIGKLRDTAEAFEMDVQMGSFPMSLTMTKAGDTVRLVFSNAGVWKKFSAAGA